MKVRSIIVTIAVLSVGLVLALSLTGSRPADPATQNGSTDNPQIGTVSTENDLTQAIGENSGVVFLTFSASWCPGCVRFKPVLNRAASEFQDSAAFLVADTDQSKDLAARYKVQYLPTTVVFKGGVEVERFVGPKSLSEIESIIEGA